jgi:hypothetical protein
MFRGTLRVNWLPLFCFLLNDHRNQQYEDKHEND